MTTICNPPRSEAVLDESTRPVTEPAAASHAGPVACNAVADKHRNVVECALTVSSSGSHRQLVRRARNHLPRSARTRLHSQAATREEDTSLVDLTMSAADWISAAARTETQCLPICGVSTHDGGQ